MGGIILKYLAPRLPAADYHALAGKLENTIRACSHQIRVQRIPAYESKPTFGDLDLIIDYGPASARQSNREAVLAALAPTEVVRAGNVTAVSISAAEHGQDFQVDLIEPGDSLYEFTYRFYSFNDLGNLIARIAHLAGFKLDARGLHYLLRNPVDQHHVISEIPVSLDWDAILSFLGYDPAACNEKAGGGFRSITDVFEFATSTPYFDAEAYLPQNMDHASRLRDAERPTYAAFLQWLDSACPKHRLKGARASTSTKERHRAALDSAFDIFVGFSERLHAAQETTRRERQAKGLMGIQVVAGHTGAWGKELSEILAEIARRFQSVEDRVSWVIGSTRKERELVMESAAKLVRERHARAVEKRNALDSGQ